MFIHKVINKISYKARRLLCLLANAKSTHLKNHPFSYLYDLEVFKQHSLVSHAGNAGDIIFSCLLAKALFEETGLAVKFHLQTNVHCYYPVKHPLKNVMLSDKMAYQLKPLLLAQSYISEVLIGNASPEIPYLNLNQFRKLPIKLYSHLIQGWQQMCTDLWLNVHQPWIVAKKLAQYEKTIIVCRTERLRSEYINYKFLKDFQKNILFIGVQEEFDLFQKQTGIDCPNMVASDFELLAAILNSCRLVVANQGFLYSLAESLQCPRVLESNTIAPNNFPMSPNGRVALFQKPFERFVRALLEK